MRFRKFLHSSEESHTKPFVEHLEDLRWLIIKALVAVLILSVVVFVRIDYFFDHVLLGPAHPDFITYRLLCRLGDLLGLKDALCLQGISLRLQSNQMSSQFMMSFSMSLMIGFVFAFPYMIYLLWAFVKPALKPSETSKIRYVVFWVSMLFFVGVAFGYFIITPYTVHFFSSYTLSPLIENNFLLSDYIDTVLQLVIGTGLVFQLPLVIYMLTRIGFLTPEFLQQNRKYAVIIVLVIAAVITPPDVFSQLLVTIPLWLLYEIGILIAIRTQKKTSV